MKTNWTAINWSIGTMAIVCGLVGLTGQDDSPYLAAALGHIFTGGCVAVLFIYFCCIQRAGPPKPIKERPIISAKVRGVRLFARLGVVVGALLIFPPWIYTFDQNGNEGGHTTKPAGYACIVLPPRPQSDSSRSGVRLDGQRLFIECAIVGLFGLFYCFRNYKDELGTRTESGQIGSNEAEQK